MKPKINYSTFTEQLAEQRAAEKHRQDELWRWLEDNKEPKLGAAGWFFILVPILFLIWGLASHQL